MPESNEHLPIKVVIPADEDYRRTPQAKGSGKDVLTGSNYDECRDIALKGLVKVAHTFETVFSTSNLPAVARVTLRDEALAKSHHPEKLFSPRTCPIIGGENFGELLVSVRPRHLQLLLDTVHSTADKALQNDVVKILSIEPYSQKDVLGQWTIDELHEFLARRRKRAIKLRTFNHRNDSLNTLILTGLKALTNAQHVPYIEPLHYTPSQNLFRVVVDGNHDALNQLSSFVGCQSVDVFDEYSVSAQSKVIGRLREITFRPQTRQFDCPVVGLIDSGTDPNNPHLQAWVDVRDEFFNCYHF